MASAQYLRGACMVSARRRHGAYMLCAASADTDISSLPYKTPWNFYREGMILSVFVPSLYLCTACICLPCLLCLCLLVGHNLKLALYKFPKVNVLCRAVALLLELLLHPCLVFVGKR